MPTHTVKYSVTYNGTLYEYTNTQTAGYDVRISEPINTGATNLQITLKADISEIKSLLIDTDVVMTLKTNSSGSPDDLFLTTVGTPIIWQYGGVSDIPLTQDITTLYVSNASGTNGTLTIQILQDPTPPA